MALTKDKLAAALVFAIVAVASMTVVQSWGTPAIGLFVGLTISSFGLALIWFAEPLGEIACFARGLPHRSPPPMIEAFGWLFLIGYPVVLLCVMR